MNKPFEFAAFTLLGLLGAASLTLATQSGCSSGTCPDLDEVPTREGTYVLDVERTQLNFPYYVEGAVEPTLNEGATFTLSGDRLTTTWTDPDGLEQSQMWAATERGYEFSPTSPVR